MHIPNYFKYRLKLGIFELRIYQYKMKFRLEFIINYGWDK